MKKLLFVVISLLVATPANAAPKCPEPDILYIADSNTPGPGDDFIAQFDAQTGEYLGNLVSPGTEGLNGARGLIFDTQGGPHSNLLVVSQNVNEPNPGAVLVFDRRFDDTQLDPLIPSTDPDAPFAPQGIVLLHNVLYVASAIDANGGDGSITMWHARTGTFLGALDLTGYDGEAFHPRGMVVGPDGDLYVSVSYDLAGAGGAIVRFDLKTGEFVDIVYECTSDDPSCDLHRPDALAFGPDDLLYVTSFRRDMNDIDRILIFDVTDTEDPLVGSIDLWQLGEPRAFAQGLLFGPDGDLFVPISGGSADHAGSVRIYDVTNPETYTVFVPATSDGGPLVNPRYLTFGLTDPATLAYEGKKQCQ
jgi:hypothetical protein